jgi:hypothetical protein
MKGSAAAAVAAAKLQTLRTCFLQVWLEQLPSQPAVPSAGTPTYIKQPL